MKVTPEDPCGYTWCLWSNLQDRICIKDTQRPWIVGFNSVISHLASRLLCLNGQWLKVSFLMHANSDRIQKQNQMNIYILSLILFFFHCCCTNTSVSFTHSVETVV